MKPRDTCINCRRPVVLRSDAEGWQHIFTSEKCDNPIPSRVNDPPCTCDYPHMHCYVVTCKCEQHKFPNG